MNRFVNIGSNYKSLLVQPQKSLIYRIFSFNITTKSEGHKIRLEPCPFGLRKWLDPVVVIFFAKNIYVVKITSPKIINSELVISTT